tara:strand:- start:92 stop:292 length:201 start_codon:yes stop_codon:yes gene_type:complete
MNFCFAIVALIVASAIAGVIIYTVNARCTIQAGVGSAVINVYFAIHALRTNWAAAVVMIFTSRSKL